MSEDDLKKQILQARWITKRTGQLAEIQTRQLQLWGLISFVNAGVDDVKIYFDWETRTITYDVAVFLGKKGKGKNKLFEINTRLNGWVQDLLGEEYRTLVKSKGKIVFEGSRKIGIEDGSSVSV